MRETCFFCLFASCHHLGHFFFTFILFLAAVVEVNVLSGDFQAARDHVHHRHQLTVLPQHQFLLLTGLLCFNPSGNSKETGKGSQISPIIRPIIQLWLQFCLTDWLLVAAGSSSGRSKMSSSRSLTLTCFTASSSRDSGFTRCWWTPDGSTDECGWEDTQRWCTSSFHMVRWEIIACWGLILVYNLVLFFILQPQALPIYFSEFIQSIQEKYVRKLFLGKKMKTFAS